MDYKAEQKYILMSPQKIRALVAVLKTKNPLQAIEVLPHYGKRAYLPLQKVLKTAVANAKQAGEEKELLIKEIMVNEGPVLRRGRAGARGRLKPYKRRMSHIRVVLTTRKSEVLNPKSESKSKTIKSTEKPKKIKTENTKKDAKEKDTKKERSKKTDK